MEFCVAGCPPVSAKRVRMQPGQRRRSGAAPAVAGSACDPGFRRGIRGVAAGLPSITSWTSDFQHGRGNGDGLDGPGTGGLTVNLIEKFFEDIASAQDQFDDGAVDDELVLAGKVEERLEDVGEAVDGDEIEKTGAALESVERAENSIQGLGIVRPVLEHEDALLDVIEVFAGFVDEFAEKFGIIGEVQIERGFLCKGIGLRGSGGLERKVDGRATSATGAAAAGRARRARLRLDTPNSKSFNQEISSAKKGWPDSTILTMRSQASAQMTSRSGRPPCLTASSRRLPMMSRMGNWPEVSPGAGGGDLRRQLREQCREPDVFTHSQWRRRSAVPRVRGDLDERMDGAAAKSDAFDAAAALDGRGVIVGDTNLGRFEFAVEAGVAEVGLEIAGHDV